MTTDMIRAIAFYLPQFNEWAEGNVLKPDMRYGHQYLEVVRDELSLPNSSPMAGVAQRKQGIFGL